MRVRVRAGMWLATSRAASVGSSSSAHSSTRSYRAAYRERSPSDPAPPSPLLHVRLPLSFACYRLPRCTLCCCCTPTPYYFAQLYPLLPKLSLTLPSFLDSRIASFKLTNKTRHSVHFKLGFHKEMRAPLNL